LRVAIVNLCKHMPILDTVGTGSRNQLCSSALDFFEPWEEFVVELGGRVF
jgi:hypothetical protein